MKRAYLACAGLALVLLGGCAEERPPIDRVQPYALDKTFFVGQDFVGTDDDPEFWTQGTLIDVGYGASQGGLFTSTYAQPVARLRWQITEDMLIGRISYERIDGTDGRGINEDGAERVQDGVIAVAFRILSHFDIMNAYNPTTGEELNIRNENMSDRPWYERKYMRVDWTRNLNMDSYDFDTLSLLGLYGGLIYEPLAYDITDPHHPHAPLFDFKDGYFDVTNKAFVRPQEIDLSSFGWGIKSFPACFLDPDFLNGSGPAANCNPVEITIRHSFRRVVDTDFEPKNIDGYRFSAFGAFNQERTGYARNYGMTDAQWRRLQARYNIWQRNHYYDNPEEMTGHIACNTPETTAYGADANVDADNNGTADECEEVTEKTGNIGSQCDVHRQRCTLPFRDRTPNPVIWYYGKDSDLEYFEPTTRSTHEWDVALRLAVRSAQYAECARESGGTEGQDAVCVEDYPIHFGQQDQNESLVALTWEARLCLEAKGFPQEDGDRASCEAEIRDLAERRGLDEVDSLVSLAMMKPMVVLCHSPVEAKDHPLCGEPRLPEGVTSADCQGAIPGDETFDTCNQALTVRIGDLRYHQINVIKTPQTPSPWGIMVDSNDPTTGENIAASANVWSHVNDLWSQKIVDTLRYMGGELTTEEITEGRYISNWAEAAERAATGGMSPKMTREERDRRVIALATDGKIPHKGAAFDRARERITQPLPPSLKAQAIKLREQVKGIKAHVSAPSANQTKYMNRAIRAQNTEVESEFFDPMVQRLMGTLGLPMSDAVLDCASLLRGGNPALLRQIRHLKESALAERGSCIMQEAPAPHGFGSLSDMLQKKFGAFNPGDSQDVQLERAEKMRRYLARRAHYAVMIHEMGHSIGLRHNFVSSSDSFNYRPQYWQLRTKDGAVTEACEDLSADGEDCVGPRYYDPVTPNERDNGIWMWMHSSVMDYAGEATQDMLGLGAYDFAATRAFYGDVISVYQDESYKAQEGNNRFFGLLGKMDTFGGILGYDWDINTGGPFSIDLHYSRLNWFYDLIQDCKVVDPVNFKPSDWNDERDGNWEPTFDGLIVSVNGQYTRCKQQQVDYRFWGELRYPDSEGGEGPNFYRGGPAISTRDNRVRVPYGFGTDGWADLGNLAVYRHDNGADPYELFDFFISQQEVNHIFDNYRRGRMSFSIRGAAGRALGRYNEKMRDGAKGLGLLKSIYKDFSLNQGYNFDDFWFVLADDFFGLNLIATGIAFDHFTRQLARPESGPHFLDTQKLILRSQLDAVGLEDAPTSLTIPNGAQGLFETVSIGGRPIENRLAEDQGEFDSYYTLNAGSYYEKLYSALLMTESVDNFISAERSEFVDGRFRSISMADIFPEGYRRWLANNLTGDDFIKGPRLESDRDGNVPVDGFGYPTTPLAWTSWWGSEPRSCFPGSNAIFCDSFGNENPAQFGGSTGGFTVVVDPQVGWEQQKFLIAWTMMYLPENQQQWWIDMLRIWELGVDADPEIENRIEFHNPNGKIYIAKTFGKETIFEKTVQRGVAARVLEYANELLVQAYETTDGPDLDGDGNPDWYIPVMSEGRPLVRWDETLAAIDIDGRTLAGGGEGCNATDNSECTCEANRACVELEKYVQIPFFLRQTMDAYGLSGFRQRGIY
jgi:hypothetical protein